MASLSQVRKTISQLNRMDLNKVEYEYVRQKFSPLMDGMKHPLLIIHTDTILHRSRISRSENPIEKPTLKSDIAAPRPEYVTGFQRCNSPNKPKFYCGFSRDANLRELRVAEGDIVYRSQWKVVKRFGINTLLANTSEETYSPVQAAIHTFIEGKFTQPIHETYSSQYKITSAISEVILSVALGELSKYKVEITSIEALLYPSVEDSYKSDNIVIGPETAEECLNLVYVEEIKITVIENGKYEYELLDYAENFPDGKISWSGKTKSYGWVLTELGQKMELISEWDESKKAFIWVRYDEEGNVVEPQEF